MSQIIHLPSRSACQLQVQKQVLRSDSCVMFRWIRLTETRGQSTSDGWLAFGLASEIPNHKQQAGLRIVLVLFGRG